MGSNFGSGNPLTTPGANVDLSNIKPVAPVSFNSQRIIDVLDPVGLQDVVTLDYFNSNPPAGSANVDLSNILPTASVDFNSQKLINVLNPTAAQDVVTLDYFDNNPGAGANIPLSNILPVASVDFNSQKLIEVLNPTNPQDVVTLNYFDNNPGGGANRALSNLNVPTSINTNLVQDGISLLWDIKSPNTAGGSAIVRLISGSSSNASFPGGVFISTADTFNAASLQTGNITISTGVSSLGGATVNTGDLNLSTGSSGASAGGSGNVNVSAGTSGGSGIRGDVTFSGLNIDYNSSPNIDHVWENGVTGSRPANAVGKTYFDTTLGIPIWNTGAGWVDATGAAA